MAKEKTVKMRFPKDVFYRDPSTPLYLAGKAYDIPESMVHKWLKRGADIVGEETASKPNTPPPDPVVVPPVAIPPIPQTQVATPAPVQKSEEKKDANKKDLSKK